jgi:hypothetical protein
MNNKLEVLLSRHIQRLEKDIAGRELDNPLHAQLNEVDAKNIASLREARIPEYGDHMEMDNDLEMLEFSDLSEEVRGCNQWLRDSAAMS